MKKILLIVMAVMVLSLTACGGNQSEEISGQSSSEKTNEEIAVQTGTELTAEKEADPKPGQADEIKGVSWPSEFSDWDIPALKKGTVVLSDNRSVSGGVLTQGINVVVNLKDVSKADFDDYCSELKKNGFEKSADSLADVLLGYEKTVEGGIIKMTLTFSENGVTIIANNSAAEAIKNDASVSSGDVQWPDTLKGIPVFTKGNYKETVEMGGNMYAITYTGITESDLEWYRGLLENEGFMSQETDDYEGYMKMDGSKAFSVGFSNTEGTMQIVATVGNIVCNWRIY